MRFFVSQIDPQPGKVERNITQIVHNMQIIQNQMVLTAIHSDVIVSFPELCIPGYPALDLYLSPSFQKECEAGLQKIIEQSKNSKGIFWIIGTITQPEIIKETHENNRFKCYNSALVINGGEIIKTIHKQLLPDYDIFFENRYFISPPVGSQSRVFEAKDFEKTYKIAVLICEDMWEDGYSTSISTPYYEAINEKPDAVVTINASPYSVRYIHDDSKIYSRILERKDNALKVINKYRSIHYPNLFVSTNCFGSQDGYDGEVIFDGQSFAGKIGETFLDKKRKLDFKEFIKLPFLKESTRLIATIRPDFQDKWISEINFDFENMQTILDKTKYEEDIELYRIIESLSFGIKSYCQRSGIKKAIIGLSGGIDSALTADLAVRALGADNVMGVAMPGPYSSPGSINDAYKLAANLDIEMFQVPIGDSFQTLYNEINESIIINDMSPEVEYELRPLVSENLQARIRGNTLMAFANQYNAIVLSTGNKTELSLGYCTAFGDMVGGLSPIADLPKNLVYRISRLIHNTWGTIPIESIEKPPSAELAPDQTDEATLGSYDIISPLTQLIVERDLTNETLVFYGYKQEDIDKVRDLIKKSEWKRRIAAPGIRITSKAFGSGRRIPL